MSALCKMQCCNISSVEQIWGPPGTGKTMTVSVLLFILLQLKKRSLTCAPTNVAVVQLASRVQSLISLEGLALPCFSNKYATKQFCFESASLIFCTTSSSYKLHAVNMEPLNIVHAILIEDECQLPALVNINVCIASGFGRSLFNRLSSLGHSEHLLSVQYRMHPSISFFPYQKFYHNQILDAQNVLSKGYEKRYLSGPMFGSYSFINFVGGREEKDDDGRSRRNMVEVAVVGLWLLRVTFIRIEIREPIGGTHEYTKNGLEIHMTGNLVPGTVEESLQKYAKYVEIEHLDHVEAT
ncbi:UvrD-like helicase, ATP-binding domain, P-loop containing nucleoside triphosphate hydrolase [Tanacetum coccineum]